MYFVDSGRPLPGAPPLLKTRSHLHLKQARDLWWKIVLVGPKKVLMERLG